MSLLWGLYVVSFVLGFVSSWAFIFLYHFTSKWWTTFVGRHFMGYGVVVALVFLRGMINLIGGRIPPPDVLSVILTCLVAAVTTWRVVVYVRLEYMTKKRKERMINE